MQLHGYEEIIQLAQASRRGFKVQTYLGDNQDLLIRITPGVTANENQFELWMADFIQPERRIHTSAGSLYVAPVEGFWDFNKLQEYMRNACKHIVSDLSNLF